MLYDQIVDSLFDCALVAQYLVNNGWRLEKEEGEKRLGISPKMTLSKGSFTKVLFDFPSLATAYEIEEEYSKI